jgi:hypothetical protein
LPGEEEARAISVGKVCSPLRRKIKRNPVAMEVLD